MITSIDFNCVSLQVIEIYNKIFSQNEWALPEAEYPIHVTREKVFLGDEILARSDFAVYENDDLLLLREQKTALKGLAQCVNMNWMVILVSNFQTCSTSSIKLHIEIICF